MQEICGVTRYNLFGTSITMEYTEDTYTKEAYIFRISRQSGNSWDGNEHND